MHALFLEKDIIHKRYTGNQHAKVKTHEARYLAKFAEASLTLTNFEQTF